MIATILGACSYADVTLTEEEFAAATPVPELGVGEYLYENLPDWSADSTLHIGVSIDACLRGPEDATVTQCDYVEGTAMDPANVDAGLSGLREALSDLVEDAESDEGIGAVELLLYPTAPINPATRGGDNPAQFYQVGNTDIPGGVHIHAAPGTKPDDVQLECILNDVGPRFYGLALRGHAIHLRGFSLLMQLGCDTGISAWPTPISIFGEAENILANITGEHTIENIQIRALASEVHGSNGIDQPVQMGGFSVLRNNYFYGYIETKLDLRGAAGSTIMNNTTMPYQVANAPWNLEGAEKIKIINNVIISTVDRISPQFHLNEESFETEIRDNVFVGYAEPLAGFESVEPTARDGLITEQGNILGKELLTSPADPRFNSVASLPGTPAYPSEGTSFDGYSLDGSRQWLPGAFQDRSEAAAPVMYVEVGADEDRPTSHDYIHANTANAVQVAMWSIWPGGTVRVRPRDQPYAGGAVISWGSTLEGLGVGAADGTVIVAGVRDPLMERAGLFDRHGGIIAVLADALTEVNIRDLSLEQLEASLPMKAAIISESFRAPDIWRSFERLRLINSSPTMMRQGALLGDHTIFRDTVVAGHFKTCLRYGHRLVRKDGSVISLRETDAVAWHVTCRAIGLAGDGNEVESAFRVPGVGGIFANLVVEVVPATTTTSTDPEFPVFTGGVVRDLEGNESIQWSAAGLDAATTAGRLRVSGLSYAADSLYIQKDGEHRLSQGSGIARFPSSSLFREAFSAEVDEHRFALGVSLPQQHGASAPSVFDSYFTDDRVQVPVSAIVAQPALDGAQRDYYSDVSGAIQGAYSLSGTLLVPIVSE